MKESTEGHAVLEDVEEDAFIGFCEFAYLGAYKTPQRSEETYDTNLGNSTERESDLAEERRLQPDPEPELEPELEPEPEPDDVPAQEWDPMDGPAPNGRVPMNNWDMYTTRKDWISFRRKLAYGIPLPEEKESAKHVTYVQYPYDGLWEQFRELRFTGTEASQSTIPDLVFHGKLYVFATRYLVDSLRTQCLKSLHRDLCKFSLNKRNTNHVFDLIEYAYQESGRGEPEGESTLRNLVIHYAACEARTLAEDPRLRDLLNQFSEMGSDMVTKLVN
ncbi:hypothetical protein NUU61_001372 [Penicillium alfredii]|uniref:BTB domain-containing protein n=1 Tax=Penicillium alfredii TaxID=1506179 RepID=A0A9W9G5M6_9EURO|nr:uncharacterized protein NUU61_001372 [Penicillium alfredii]KAJ5111742.1 hypothetical protein NUU61_001372 [Penicillium alfredii]